MAAPAAARQPFFVVGSPRSGTTLVRFVLASHPELWLPDETGFLPFLRTPPDRPLDRREVRRAARRIAKLNHEWTEVAGRLERRAPELEGRTLGEVLDLVYRERMGDDGVRWGDKTPGYVHHLAAIDAMFPTALVVHVIRDGRDVAVSALAKWGRRLPWRLWLDETAVLRRWRRAVEDGRRAGDRLGPSRYHEVRYEDLVGEPEATVRRLCGFLGERFEPDMLRHERLARATVADDGHVEVRRPIDAARVGRWRAELGPAGRWAAAGLVGGLLDELGYDPDVPPPPSRAERVRLAGAAARAAAVDAAGRLAERAGWSRLNRGKRRRRPPR